MTKRVCSAGHTGKDNKALKCPICGVDLPPVPKCKWQSYEQVVDYLLDQFRGRASFTETLEAVKRMVTLWPESREKLVEDKANGPAIIDVLSKKISGFIAVPVEGNKESRGASVSWLFEAGNVYFPDPKKHPWVVECVTEITRFPMAAYDDQFDAATQALARFMKIPMIDSTIPTAAINIGASTALNCSSGLNLKAAAPSAAVARIDPQ